jgi:hypothetical protein
MVTPQASPPPAKSPTKDCPPPPTKPDGSLDVEALGFEPFKPMVRWFAPKELIRSGIKATLSALFGAYADNRELQAVRGQIEEFRYDDDDEIWVDYVADLGDGWDSTYAVARTLAEETQEVDGHRTERGRILIMGGDQVYPTATRKEYDDRLIGPYRAALPCVWPEEKAPHLYAVPGNHDWYDGLTSFTRLFCQDRWIGGWRTRQTRSYFALKLPHDWWLWGIDIQLGADLDEPQLDFFYGLGKRIKGEGRQAKIILCVAEPTWVFTGREGDQGGPKVYENLAYFEQKTITGHGHRHVVGLSGDLHTYARYEDPKGPEGHRRQRFVAGGGGAYLYPTHKMPVELTIPAAPLVHRKQPDTFVLAEDRKAPGRKAVFPDMDTSRRLTWGSLLLFWQNRALCAVIGGLYLVVAWLMQSASKALNPSPSSEESTSVDPSGSLLSTFSASSLEESAPPDSSGSLLSAFSDPGTNAGDAFSLFFEILKHAPGAVLVLLGLLAGLMAFADFHLTIRLPVIGRVPVNKIVAGFLHCAGHVALLIVLMWAFAKVNLARLGLPEEHIGQVLLFSFEMILFGGVLGGVVLGAYLFISNRVFGRFGAHTNEVLVCQSIPDYKHFLRLCINSKGLTIYPIGIPDVPRGKKGWRFDSKAGPGEAWFEPAQGNLKTVLAEAPIVLTPDQPPPAPGPDGASG